MADKKTEVTPQPTGWVFTINDSDGHTNTYEGTLDNLRLLLLDVQRSSLMENEDEETVELIEALCNRIEMATADEIGEALSVFNHRHCMLCVTKPQAVYENYCDWWN